MKKIAARVEVKRVKKFAPPELPKTVWLEPPRVALMSAPLPDWSKTTRTKRTHVMIWTVVTKEDMGSGIAEGGQLLKRLFVTSLPISMSALKAFARKLAAPIKSPSTSLISRIDLALSVVTLPP